jgi:hypothetical protein
MTKRDLKEWDREIEADFQRTVAATKAAGKAKRGRRYIGAPLAFVVEVLRLTEGRTTLVVALCIYRRTKVCGSPTVTLPGSELAELGINRRRKHEALAKLEAVGLIRAEGMAGRSTDVTLAWKPR